MTFCKFFKNSIQPEHSFTGELALSISSLEPSLVIYSMSQEDSEMVRLLNKRLMMYIGVQGSVESILGAIFETYLRNGFVDGGDRKINIRNILSDDTIRSLLEYYGEVPEVMNIIYRYCYIKDNRKDLDNSDSD